VFAGIGNLSLNILISCMLTFVGQPLPFLKLLTMLLNCLWLSKCNILQTTLLGVKEIQYTMTRRYIGLWLHLMRLTNFEILWRCVVQKKWNRIKEISELVCWIMCWWLLYFWKRTSTLWEIACKMLRIE